MARTWVALAAIGVGLLHLASVLDAPDAATIPLAIVGVVAFGWGVLVLFDAHFLAPRVALVAALAPLLLWPLVLATGVAPLPIAVASLLELFVASAIAVTLRRGPSTAVTPTGRLVIGVLVGVLVIGSVTAVGLASTGFVPSGGSFDLDLHH